MNPADQITYGFNRADARSLTEMIGGDTNISPGGKPRKEVVHRIFMTPSGGIDARSGAVPGMASCTEYYIDADDELTATGQSYDVFNIFSTDIGGEVYITAKIVRGKLVADAEDCGEEGSA